jgi:hypothetical protein
VLVICGQGSFHLLEDNSYGRDGVVWRCFNHKFYKKMSIREGSWFSKSHILFEQIVKLTYNWIYDLPGDSISQELKLGSEHATDEWKNFAREECFRHFASGQREVFLRL